METEKQVTEEESSDPDSSSEVSGSEEDSRLSGGEADSRRERETGETIGWLASPILCYVQEPVG